MIETRSIIRCDKCKKELSKPWMTFYWENGTQSHICKECKKVFSEWYHESVEEEYPLTFKQALTEMLDGRVVQSEHDKRHVYRFDSDKYCFEEGLIFNSRWEPTSIWVGVQISKWRVVG